MMTRLPSWGDLMALMRITLNDPRDGAARILGDMPPREAQWLLFALVVVLTVFAGELATLLLVGSAASVINLAALQAGVFLLMALAMYYVGRMFGGVGAFDGALMLVAWLQFIFIFVQIAQVLLLVMLPLAGFLIVLFSVLLFLWLVVNFTAELHGFQSLGWVLLGTIAVMIVAGIGVIAISNAFGVEVMSNPAAAAS
ncbi:MAG: Yip1 family protein [Pseudomonadota bacterium]